MNVGHMKIKKDGLDNYIVNNTLNNKFVKLGIREVKYLLERLEETTELESKKEYPPLSEVQKKLLDEKFNEWGFFEKAELSKKKELSNLVIFELKPEHRFNHIIKLFKYLISPVGAFLVIVSVVLAYISIGVSQDRIMNEVTYVKLSLGGIVVIYAITFISSCIHEFCHEAACYKYTGETGKWGMKLFYLLPAFFCDVSNMYMTSSRRKCAYISAAGLLSNVVIGNTAIIIYGFVENSSELLLWIFVINLCNIILNLIPFAKYDGYWILKSITGIDNLYDKSVSLVYMMTLNPEQYRKLHMNVIRKMLMTLYGIIIYAFHWLLWIYSIYALKDLLSLNFAYLEYGLITVLGVLGLGSCISYTRKYLKSYKKYLYMEG